MESWQLANGVRIRPAMKLGRIETIKEMVAAGLGCSVLPAISLWTADRKRFQVRPLKPELSRELGLVMLQDKPLTGGMQVLHENHIRYNLHTVDFIRTQWSQ